MKLTFAIFSILSYTVCAVSIYNSAFLLSLENWNIFKIQYKKNYSTKMEDDLRYNIFLDNSHKIAKHNRNFELGLVSFSLAINQFADMTLNEFRNKMNGLINRTDNNRANNIIQSYELKDLEGVPFIEPANVQLPSDVDWRKVGAVTPIKNQQDCGSCWAFSATGSLEGQHFRHNGTLIPLSEQNLIDCSGKFGNLGCEGGWMNYAFTYVKMNHGLDTERSYPYEGEDDRCRYNPRNSGAVDAGFVNIATGSESALQAAVATVGPISVAIDASQDSFRFYQSGIYYERECSSTELDHGVLAIGYGTDINTSKDYWLVKNSWGTTWGDQGYIKMIRNKNNNCGIATQASYPLVK